MFHIYIKPSEIWLFVIRYRIISDSLTVDLREVALARDRLGCQPDNTGVPSVPFAEVSGHRWKRPPTTDVGLAISVWIVRHKMCRLILNSH